MGRENVHEEQDWVGSPNGLPDLERMKRVRDPTPALRLPEERTNGGKNVHGQMTSAGDKNRVTDEVAAAEMDGRVD